MKPTYEELITILQEVCSNPVIEMYFPDDDGAMFRCPWCEREDRHESDIAHSETCVLQTISAMLAEVSRAKDAG